MSGWRRLRLRHTWLAAGLLLIAAAAGCRERGTAQENVLREVTERGPLKLTAEVTPPEPLVGDTVRLTLRMHTPERFAVEFPDPNALTDLEAVAEPPLSGRPVTQGLDWERVYRFSPAVSGPLTIPALDVRYTRAPEASGAVTDVLATKPITLQVRSVLTTQDVPTTPRDVTGTLAPPPVPPPPWQLPLRIGLVALGGLVVLGLAWLVWSMSRRPAPPITPAEWALRELAALEQANLLAAGQIREFYYRLTEIIRAYIERRFGLAAPDMTTDEFLRSLDRSGRTLPWDTGRFAEFLTACDLVKYAGFAPAPAEAEAALTAARNFVNAGSVEPGVAA